MGGFGKNMADYIGWSTKKQAEELTSLKKKVRSKGKFGLGDDFSKTKVGRNGKRLFKLKHLQKAAKVGKTLSSVMTAAAPIFVVGDLIWGSQEENL